MLLASIYDAAGRSADGRAARETALALAQQDAGGQLPPTADALYALGDAYMALDRYAEAMSTYEQAHTTAPQDLRLHLAKGNVYFWQGKLDPAAAEYTTWGQQASADPAPHTLLGLTYDQQGNTAGALAQYAQAAQLSDCDPSVLLLLGAAQSQAGDLATAQRTYAKALEIDPQNPDVLFSAGANNLMLEDNHDAVENFAALVARRPTMIKAHYYLGVAYDGLGERDKARNAYTEAVRLGEQVSPPTVDLAFAYEQLGRVDEAIAIYIQILSDRDSADLRAYLGALYADKGATDLARQEYQRALELDPQQTLATFALANLAFAGGNWQEAAANYEAYLAHEESSSVHEYAAQAYLALGDLPTALRHLQAASTLDPGNAGLALRTANTANWLNQLDDAGIAVEQALRLQPADPAVYFTRGQLAYKRCDVAQAVTDLERSVAISPTVPLYVGSLGGYYAAQGLNEQVPRLIAQLQAEPQADYVAHWLAGSLLSLHDDAAAVSEYRIGLQAPAVPTIIAAALHTAIGRQEVLRGDAASARTEFEEALRQAPDYLDAQIWLGDLAWLDDDTTTARAHFLQAVDGLATYATRYSYDSAAIFAPALHARLALVARRLNDTAGEQAALSQAEAQLVALRQTAPDWPSVAMVEGMVALVRGDKAAAEAAFDRAELCDQTVAETSQADRSIGGSGKVGRGESRPGTAQNDLGYVQIILRRPGDIRRVRGCCCQARRRGSSSAALRRRGRGSRRTGR